MALVGRAGGGAPAALDRVGRRLCGAEGSHGPASGSCPGSLLARAAGFGLSVILGARALLLDVAGKPSAGLGTGNCAAFSLRRSRCQDAFSRALAHLAARIHWVLSRLPIPAYWWLFWTSGGPQSNLPFQ
jgi:hypothetical protein